MEHLPPPNHKEGIVTLAGLSMVDAPCAPKETGVQLNTHPDMSY